MAGMEGGPVWPHQQGRQGAAGSFYGSDVKGLDLAPSWNGEKPEVQLAGYLKAIKAWHLVTRLPLRQRGIALLSQASGDLRALLSTLEVEELTSENAVERMVSLLETEFQWSLQRTMPQRFEAALFSAAGTRQRQESLLAYTARKATLLRELSNSGLDLPDLAKGLIMLRDAHLGKAELDTIHQWAQGDFAYDKTVTMLRNLDRLPQASTPAYKTVLYDEDEEGLEEEGVDWGIEAEYEQAWNDSSQQPLEQDGAAEEVGDAEAIPED
eukprot:1286131-Amphidinium_carterae.1